MAWYGGGTRRVEAVTGAGHGHKGGNGRVPIRWVFVRGTTGTHRDEYRFATDTTRAADAVVGTYGGRGPIETTVQECRSCTGPETTRGRSRATICRAAPRRFGLYSVVAARHPAPPEGKRTGLGSWPGKDTVTLSDAVTAARRGIWAEGVFPQAGVDGAIAELPVKVRELLRSGLAPAP